MIKDKNPTFHPPSLHETMVLIVPRGATCAGKLDRGAVVAKAWGECGFGVGMLEKLSSVIAALLDHCTYTQPSTGKKN